MVHGAATKICVLFFVILLCSGLFSTRLIAGEVMVSLPDANADGVISLHAIDRQVSVPPLKKATRLHQKNRQFSPSIIVIPVGSIVDMTNDDIVYHNVFSFSKTKPFDLGLYPFGDHKEMLFDKAGVVKIFCAVHPQMYGMVLVMDTPWFKQSKGDAELLFSDIPGGLYQARLWHADKSMENEIEVTVPETGRVHISFADKTIEAAE